MSGLRILESLNASLRGACTLDNVCEDDRVDEDSEFLLVFGSKDGFRLHLIMGTGATRQTVSSEEECLLRYASESETMRKIFFGYSKILTKLFEFFN